MRIQNYTWTIFPILNIFFYENKLLQPKLYSQMWRYRPMKTRYLMSEFQKLDAWKGRLFFVHSFPKTCGGESPLAGRYARAAPLPPLWLLLYYYYIERKNNWNSYIVDINCLVLFYPVVAWNVSWYLLWLEIFHDFCCDFKNFLILFLLFTSFDCCCCSKNFIIFVV